MNSDVPVVFVGELAHEPLPQAAQPRSVDDDGTPLVPLPGEVQTSERAVQVSLDIGSGIGHFGHLDDRATTCANRSIETRAHHVHRLNGQRRTAQTGLHCD